MMNKVKILLVEDDPNLGFVIQDSLDQKGFDVSLCPDGESAWKKIQEELFDICILDILLPKMDGFELIKLIRSVNQEIPVLFLSARALSEDRITGFRLGADDYITKPFSMEELIFRIDVFVRRSKINLQEDLFSIGDYTFHSQNGTLLFDHREVQLTQKEVEVLKLFCLHLNQTIKREDILKFIWGDDDYFMGRSLDVFISKLRKHLNKDPRVSIINVFNVGFKLVVKN
ncbi:MAG TPA: response regulator transcription factor [Cytophagaceae bacterium]|jgi:DNA-binding response OmpR family regulator|nr:response regulator transcription factor [Cytophagaceae bacterium]